MPPFSPEQVDDISHSHVVIVVNPYSTGCVIAQEILKQGYKIIALYTKLFNDSEMKTHIPRSCKYLHYHAELIEKDSLEETANAVYQAASPFKVVACIAGGEAGVDLSDALSEKLGVRTNGTEIPNRRDKKIQQELVQKAGLRSVRQAGGDKFEDVEEFLQTERYPVVLKPVASAGSDGVKLCHSFNEAKDHFNLLMNSISKDNGGELGSVLCQEFLRGKEYVVDHVSRDGVHKTTMVWVYDKRPANGSAFVYYGCVPVDSESREARLVIPYARAVLDALGFKNGPSHGEVIMTDDGPCLVEMNCRAHGGDGNWRNLCRGLNGGWSQVEGTVYAYLDEEQFDNLPNKPPSPFKAFGTEVIMVSHSKGTVVATPGYNVIKHLPSFLILETGIKVGSEVDYTVDLYGHIGSVILMHPDKEVVKKDVEFIRHMEKINGVFDYETKLENLKRPLAGDEWLLPSKTNSFKGDNRNLFSSDSPQLIRHFSNDRPELRGQLIKRATSIDASKEVVVVVNPYSTACLVVKEIMSRTYKVIALYTKDFTKSDMTTHIPECCAGIGYHAKLTEKNTLADTEKAVRKAAGDLRVVACITGGESGIGLADALSEQMNVRTNGTSIPNRRDKKLQQELIKSAGLRSIRQASGSKFKDVEHFLKTEPYPVVMKPIQSAGSDGVKLCHNFEESKEHFHLLMNSISRDNGGKCEAVLCQEFLGGKEYVVDQVSRDGIHKTAMVWAYDKRPVNGAAFVYFGCVPVDSQSPEARLVIPYARAVLDALGVKNGPSHAEIMMTANGPCLVEMNCRCHGGDGNWRPLCRGLTGGYSQVEATVDAFLDKKAFSRMPDRPPSPFKGAGQEVTLVSFSRGKVKSTPGFDEIMRMESFVSFETGVKKGSMVEYTVDLYTCVGSVILMHRDEEIMQRDLNRIRELEKENLLFVYDYGVDLMMRSPSTPNVLNLFGLLKQTSKPRLYVSDNAQPYQ